MSQLPGTGWRGLATIPQPHQDRVASAARCSPRCTPGPGTTAPIAQADWAGFSPASARRPQRQRGVKLRTCGSVRSRASGVGADATWAGAGAVAHRGDTRAPGGKPGTWTLSGLLDFERAMTGDVPMSSPRQACSLAWRPRLLGRILAAYGRSFDRGNCSRTPPAPAQQPAGMPGRARPAEPPWTLWPDLVRHRLDRHPRSPATQGCVRRLRRSGDAEFAGSFEGGLHGGARGAGLPRRVEAGPAGEFLLGVWPLLEGESLPTAVEEQSRRARSAGTGACQELLATSTAVRSRCRRSVRRLARWRAGLDGPRGRGGAQERLDVQLHGGGRRGQPGRRCAPARQRVHGLVRGSVSAERAGVVSLRLDRLARRRCLTRPGPEPAQGAGIERAAGLALLQSRSDSWRGWRSG